MKVINLEAERQRLDTVRATSSHIERVGGFLFELANSLVERAGDHDKSKFEEPEFSIFVEFTPKLAALTYGSDEYKGALEQMQPALEHHYAHNRHHPEHFPRGVNNMTLVDLIEMLCDWKAATMRHNDGDITKSLEINKKRFGISDQLTTILENTAREYGWLKK